MWALKLSWRSREVSTLWHLALQLCAFELFLSKPETICSEARFLVSCARALLNSVSSVISKLIFMDRG